MCGLQTNFKKCQSKLCPDRIMHPVWKVEKIDFCGEGLWSWRHPTSIWDPNLRMVGELYQRLSENIKSKSVLAPTGEQKRESLVKRLEFTIVFFLDREAKPLRVAWKQGSQGSPEIWNRWGGLEAAKSDAAAKPKSYEWPLSHIWESPPTTPLYAPSQSSLNVSPEGKASGQFWIERNG